MLNDDIEEFLHSDVSINRRAIRFQVSLEPAWSLEQEQRSPPMSVHMSGAIESGD